MGACDHVCEMAAIGRCLETQGYASKWVGTLVPAHFYSAFFEKLFRYIQTLIEKGEEPEPVIALRVFNDDERLHHCLANYDSAISEKWVYKQLEHYRRIRGAARVCSQYMNHAMTDEGAVEAAISEFNKLIQEGEAEDYSMRTLANRAVDRWQKNENCRKAFELDIGKHGSKLRLRPGNLMYVIAPSKTGKTWLLCNIASQLSKKNQRVCFLTAEMAPDDLFTRIASHELQTDMSVLDLENNKSNYQIFGTHSNEIASMNITVSYIVGINSLQLGAKIRSAGKKHDVVIIDYLQRIHYPSAKDLRVATSQTSGMLADAARKENVLIICASQAGRQAYHSEVTEIYHAKESGAIEADADTLLTMKDTTDYENDNWGGNPNKQLALRLVQRNGDSFTYNIQMNPITGRIL
jgi:replicative DNA helicase